MEASCRPVAAARPGVPRAGRLRPRASHRSRRLAALRRRPDARRARSSRGSLTDCLSARGGASGSPGGSGVPGRAEAAGGAAVPGRVVAPAERKRLDRQRLPDVGEDARSGRRRRPRHRGGPAAGAARGRAGAGGATGGTPPRGGRLRPHAGRRRHPRSAAVDGRPRDDARASGRQRLARVLQPLSGRAGVQSGAGGGRRRRRAHGQGRGGVGEGMGAVRRGAGQLRGRCGAPAAQRAGGRPAVRGTGAVAGPERRGRGSGARRAREAPETRRTTRRARR